MRPDAGAAGSTAFMEWEPKVFSLHELKYARVRHLRLPLIDLSQQASTDPHQSSVKTILLRCTCSLVQEAALYVLRTNSSEDAVRIFTEVRV